MEAWTNVTALQTLNTTDEILGNIGRRGLLTLQSLTIGNCVVIPVRTCFCAMGLVLNGLTIRAFYRTGIKDSVTVVLFVQAILDFLVLAWSFNYPLLSTLAFAESDWNLTLPFSPLSVLVFTAKIIRVHLDTTCTLTTFLAVQRCLCVALPLQFKGLFTRRRTVIILTSIVTFHVFFNLVLVATYEFKWIVIPPHNISRHVFVYNSRWIVGIFVDFMFNVVLNTANQIIVTFCVIFMASVLIKSVRFRSKRSSATSGTGSNHPKDGENSESKNGPSSAPATTTTATLEDTKELLVIKQVALVCTIFLFCNIPRFCFSFATSIEPEFDMRGRYGLVFRLFYSIKILFEFLNCSLNFFVYYRYNDRFRKSCFGGDLKIRRNMK